MKTKIRLKIRFTEDIDGIFEDKEQKGITGHFTKKIRETGRTNQTSMTAADRNTHRPRLRRCEKCMDKLVTLLSQEGQKQHIVQHVTYKEMGLTQCSIVFTAILV